MCRYIRNVIVMYFEYFLILNTAHRPNYLCYFVIIAMVIFEVEKLRYHVTS